MGVAHRGAGGWYIEFDSMSLIYASYIVLVPLMHGSSSLMDSLSTSQRLGITPSTFHSDPWLTAKSTTSIVEF
jgi:hypothetical protein